MKTKKTICIILAVIFGCIALLVCSCYYGCRWYNKAGWQEVYNYYTSKKGIEKYVKFEAKIVQTKYSSKGCGFELDLKEEGLGFSTNMFVVRGANYETLKESGFLDMDKNDIFVEFVSNPMVFWDGWACPIVAVKVDDTIYLDEETGKANWLEYIQERIKYYS